MTEETHTFRDPALRDLALTHASLGTPEDNERLEFLGDAVLDLIIAEELYAEESSLSEGEMTERKAWVVSRETLAGAARSLGLESMARFGHGMRGRSLPRSVLANLYEAYLGAIYLDAGLETARRFALASLAEELRRVRNLDDAHNPKQEFQHRCQEASGELPRYVLLNERGKAHARAFLVRAEVGELRYPSAWGRTRKEAERWAASEALFVQDQLQDDCSAQDPEEA